MTSVKEKLGKIFKEKDTSHLQEQVEILNKLLISKEEDLQSRENHFKSVVELHKEKERKSQALLEEKRAKIRSMENDLLQCDENCFQKEKRIQMLETELEETAKTVERVDFLENELKDKIRFKAEADQLRNNLKALESENDRLRLQLQEIERNWKNETSDSSHQHFRQIRAVELTNAFMEWSQLEGTPSTVHDGGQNTPQSATGKEERFPLELSRLVILTATLLERKVDELFDRSSLTPDLFLHLRSLESRMKKSDQNFTEITEKVRIFEEMLLLKDDCLAQCQNRMEVLQKRLHSREMEESTATKSLETLEESLTIKEKLSDEVKKREGDLQTIRKELQSLKEEKEKKDLEIGELSSTLKRIQRELAEKDVECDTLKNQLRDHRKALIEKETTLKDLLEETSRVEESLHVNHSMALTYSEAHQAKLESLRKQEELVVHFEDLLKQTDEEIRLTEEQVTHMFQKVTIIDNYTNVESCDDSSWNFCE